MTNKTPAGTYRAPGRFESSFVRERLVDLFAAEIGMDPIEVRRRSLIRPSRIPYSRPLSSTGQPMVFSDGDFPAVLEKLAGSFDWEALEKRRALGEKVGAGAAVFLEKSGLGPWETGSIEVDPDGLVRVRSGCSSVGQGIRTVLAQIAADRLELDHSQIRVELLDTDRTPLRDRQLRQPLHRNRRKRRDDGRRRDSEAGRTGGGGGVRGRPPRIWNTAPAR